MKNKTMARIRRSRPADFTQAPALIVLFALLGLGPLRVAHAASPTDLLEQGIYAEETKGELKAATELYQRIVDDPQAPRTLVAQAQLRLGLCHLKLGNKPQAISTLERLTQEFPDKDKLLAVVEQHMPELLDDMLRQIEQNYIHEVDRGELMETALRAIVGKLDGQGILRANDLEFLNTNELAQINVQMDQKLAGIGVVLKAEGGDIVVAEQPFPGSPALEGGLRRGDRILSINGVALPRTKALESAVKSLRGPVGTPVTVGVIREGSPEPVEVNLVRNTIRLPTLSGAHRKPDNTPEFMLDEDKKIGYIRVSSFGNRTATEMTAAVNDLDGRGMRALILDLRDNPGGVLDGSVAIADLFVEKGRILTVKGRSGETVYEAKAEGTFTNFLMAALVNSKTSSAAEIVAACLQDHRRAVVIGERTFGQGVVKSFFQLKNGMGALKLPVATYFRPNGHPMNRYPEAKDMDQWGVTPDDGYVVAPGDDPMDRALEYFETRWKTK